MTATDRVEAAARVILAELGYHANFPAMTAIVPVAAKALAAADAAALAQAEGLAEWLMDEIAGKYEWDDRQHGNFIDIATLLTTPSAELARLREALRKAKEHGEKVVDMHTGIIDFDALEYMILGIDAALAHQPQEPKP